MMDRSLAGLLAQGRILHLGANISHTRLGALRHAFRYRADYLLFAPEQVTAGQGLLRRNSFGIFALNDRDTGGARGAGQGAAWVWAQLAAAGIDRAPDLTLGLLTQPRMLGFSFNPVSFWLLWRGDDLIAMLAEVNNTFGQRHSYICRNPDFAPITGQTPLRAGKVFHVSPFQDVAGDYLFRLSLCPDAIDILIRHQSPSGGLVARMKGGLHPLRQSALLRMGLARPGGGLRILALILFEALRLKRRGAVYRPLPTAPAKEVSE